VPHPRFQGWWVSTFPGIIDSPQFQPVIPRAVGKVAPRCVGEASTKNIF
jgi:hypothetical protein